MKTRSSLPAIVSALLAFSALSAYAQESGSLTGIILDSLHNEPLANASITLQPGTARVESDSFGRFVFRGIVAARYKLSVSHPLLDSLGVSVAIPTLEVTGDKTPAVALAVPSLPSLKRSYCGKNADGPVLLGRVLRGGVSAPVAEAHVLIDWYEIGLGKSGVTPVYRSRDVRTNELGFYAVCNLPPEFDASITADADSLSTPKISVSSTNELTLAPWLLLPSRTPSSGLLRGKVTAAGRPLAEASIEIFGQPSRAETDSSGNYRITGMSAGTTLMRARKIGYVASIVPANVPSEGEVKIDFELEKPSTTLETVVVRARKSDVAVRSGFNDRARRGFGRFINVSEIAKLRGGCIADLLRRRSGLLRRGGGCSVLARTGTNGSFGFRGITAVGIPQLPGNEAQGPPSQAQATGGGYVLVYVDGFLESSVGGEISLSSIAPGDVVGIEIHPSSNSVAVAIWTIYFSGTDRGIAKPQIFPPLF
jgi:hypothetical protein